jgi:hypothetical protein
MTYERLILSTFGLLLASCAHLKSPELCADLVAVICDHAADECFPPVSESECEQYADDADIDCEEVVAVSDDYDACMDAIRGADECLLESGLPAECEEVLIYLD